MEQTKRQEALFKVGMVISKIGEVVHWIGVVSMIVVLVMCIFASSSVLGFIDESMLFDANGGTTIEAYGFQLDCADKDGNVNVKAISVFSVAAFISLGLMAMVFRNIYLVLKSIIGKNGVKSSPFAKDNVRMIREIGIFSISLPIIGLIMQCVAILILGWENVEAAVSLDGFIVGIIGLCLTQIFAYGASLQSDVDGLV